MKPGKAVDMNKTFWRPTGTADGVFYLGSKPADIALPSRLRAVKIVDKPSGQAEAMRYLRPCSNEWHKTHAGRNGVDVVGLYKGAVIAGMPPEFVELAKEQGRPIVHGFTTEGEIMQAIREDPFGMARAYKWHKCTDEIYGVTIERGEE
ncbi:MAG: hypothetical protein GY851_03410 [bacterium]|nr:hypothetical protein [bacterium]